MIKAMQVRGFSVRTHESHLAAAADLARYFHRAPDQLRIEDLRVYFEHLATERSLSGASCRLFLHGIRFLYLQVLDWQSFDVEIPIPKKAQRIPELLTRAEVGRILTACTNPKHRMMLILCYGYGLRLSELMSVKVRDLDGERKLLRVEQGKGAKDRLVPLSDTLLTQ
jgi:site-specific recombinase XerD